MRIVRVIQITEGRAAFLEIQSPGQMETTIEMNMFNADDQNENFRLEIVKTRKCLRIEIDWKVKKT